MDRVAAVDALAGVLVLVLVLVRVLGGVGVAALAARAVEDARAG